MAIHFNEKQWDKVAKRFGDWWAGKSETALVNARVRDIAPTRPAPPAPILTQATCADFSFTPKQLIDRADYELSQFSFIGDAFPQLNMTCFGPGVCAAFMGAKLDNSSGRVWFSAEKEITDISELHFTYDNTNMWLQRVLEICHEGAARWQGEVIVGMVDMGGILDILASFLDTQNLLVELYDNPEEVKRLQDEIIDLWLKFYRDINDVLAPARRGYTDWSLIYSDRPSYILQSDFSYMIGSDMFGEFVMPELTRLTRSIENTIYHLDGKGQVPHLDQLVTLEHLKAVQWVPGDGEKPFEQWPEVYRKVIDAKKGVMTHGSLDQYKKIVSDLGSPKGVFHNFDVIPNDKEYIERIKKEFCV